MIQHMVDASMKPIRTHCPAYSEEDLATIAYGLETVFNEVSKVLIMIIPFSLLFSLQDFLLCMLFWGAPRLLSGGLHAKTWLQCFLSASFVILLVLAGAKYLPISGLALPLLLLACLLLVLWLAPVDHRLKPIRNPKRRRKLKLLAALSIVMESVIILLLPQRHIAMVGCYALFAVVLLMMSGAWVRSREKRNMQPN